MRVVGRKIGERIGVPHCEWSVTVLGIDGNAVRLGMTAPAEIGGYREEPWRRVCSKSAPPDPPSFPITELNQASLRPRE
jgi:carbon storage regulator CsrA